MHITRKFKLSSVLIKLLQSSKDLYITLIKLKIGMIKGQKHLEL